MDYLQIAKDKLDQSTGDVRDRDHRDRLTALAMAYAAIAQAEAAQRQADSLEEIANKLNGMLDAYVQVHF
jgi:hypothetical protein